MTSTERQELDAVLQSAINAYHAGKVSQAINVLTRRSNDFKAGKLWGYLGFLYTETRNDRKAAAAFRKAVALSPRSELASLGLFHSLWRIGRVDAAFNEMRRFIKSTDSPRYRQLLRDMLGDTPRSPAPADELLVA